MSDIQALVDALAAELDRPVGLDDHRFRALSYSSHVDRVDQVRMVSIMRREAPQEVTAWLESIGVRDAEEFVRVAANPHLGMSARVCVPVRFDGILLGFLWLIDEPAPLSADQLEGAVRYAEELAVALYRARVLEQDSRERERELVGQVVGASDGDPVAAAAELITDGSLAASHAYLALVLSARHADGEEVPDPIQVRLADAAERVRRSVAPHHMLVCSAGGELVVVLVPSSPLEAARRGEALAASAAKALANHPEWKVRVGIGEQCETLGALRASYRQARDAVRVVHALDGPQRVVNWADLGAYQIIVRLLEGSDACSWIPEPLARLIADDDGELLTRTLERYLDLGGDARAAAAALYIHRSSLYGRLRRAERVAGVDLSSGEDRLEMHLGIRILRLSGGGQLSGGAA
jgi:sugar diacid utilization regulator